MIKIQLKRKQPSRLRKRLKNKARLRKRISGTKERPRLCVFKSNKYIYAQLIDDVSGKTLLQASSLKSEKAPAVSVAQEVGKKLGELAKQKKINTVVFDRGGFIYHGRVRALADGARSAGLKF